jgi:hypothetical protein
MMKLRKLAKDKRNAAMANCQIGSRSWYATQERADKSEDCAVQAFLNLLDCRNEDGSIARSPSFEDIEVAFDLAKTML